MEFAVQIVLYLILFFFIVVLYVIIIIDYSDSDTDKINDVKIDKIEIDNKVLNERLSSLDIEHRDDKSRITTLEFDNNSNKSRITALESGDVSNNNYEQNKINSLETDNTSNKSRITTLETDNTSNKSNITTLQSLVTANKSNITTLQSLVTSNKSNITALQSDNSSNKNKINALDSDNTSNKNSITTLQSDNTSNKNKINTLEQQVKKLKSNKLKNLLINKYSESKGGKVFTSIQEFLNFLLDEDGVETSDFHNVSIQNVFVNQTFKETELGDSNTFSPMKLYTPKKGVYIVIKQQSDSYYICDIIVTYIAGFYDSKVDYYTTKTKDTAYLRINYGSGVLVRFSICHLLFIDEFTTDVNFIDIIKYNIQLQLDKKSVDDLLFFPFFNNDNKTQRDNFVNNVVPSTYTSSFITPEPNIQKFSTLFSFYFGTLPLTTYYYINIRDNIELYRFKVYELYLPFIYN